MHIPTFQIMPHVGIGPVKLGATRAGCRDALFAAGFPLEDSRDSTDYFGDSAIQIECAADESVWFIGVSHSSKFKVTFLNQDVFACPAEGLFSLIANADKSGPHTYTPVEYCFPNQIVTLWDADEQYDYEGHQQRPVWGQVGLGNERYVAAVDAIRERV